MFLHKVKDGAADKSYGVHVAELAEMPAPIIERARILLEQFEAQDKPSARDATGTSVSLDFISKPSSASAVNTEPAKQPAPREEDLQLSLFAPVEEISTEEKEVLKALEKCNVMGTTPLQAMNLLYELQQKLVSKK